MKLQEDQTTLPYQLQLAIWQAWQATAEKAGWKEDLLKPKDIIVKHPDNEQFGDYTCNVIMILAGRLKSSRSFLGGSQGATLKAKKLSLVLAELILQHLTKNLNIKQLCDKVQVDSPGYINISIKSAYFITQLQELLKCGDKFGQSDGLKNKKIMVEFAHPNTHKAFHIGHLRNITTGESIVRILQANGASLIRSNYQGDVGMHIAKCLWGIMQIKNFQSEIKKPRSLKQKVRFISDAYVAGTRAYEDDPLAKQEIKNINYLVYASAQMYQQKEHNIKPGATDYLQFVEGKKKALNTVYDLWLLTRQWSLEQFEHVYNRVYSHFDRYYFESECLGGVDEARQALKKGILKKSRGAVVFDGAKYGLHTRVFINSLGLPTYEGKELSLASKELSEFGHLDRIIHCVTPEQTSFFQITFKVEELLGWQKDQQYHLAYEWVKLKHGKMSSRVGNIILGEWLLDEVKARIKHNFPDLDDNTAEMVAIGAVKYSILKQGIYTAIKFDIDESISIQGNSGPYLQYTYARCKSVLQKAGKSTRTDPAGLQGPSLTKQINPQELSILRWLYRYLETVRQAAENYAPSLVCAYLYELAQRFNTFYNKHRILGLLTPGVNTSAKSSLPTTITEKIDSTRTDLVDRQDPSLKSFRLALTAATAQVLTNGLYLLGIKAPEKM